MKKNVMKKLSVPMKKSELVARLAALEKARAKEKADQKKAIIIGAAVAGVAAAAAGAYMFLRKKEITIQLHCEIEDRKKPLVNDACCCTDDEPIEEAAEECCCTCGDAEEETAQCCEETVCECTCCEDCADAE